MSSTDVPPVGEIITESWDRVVPKITDANRHFWQGGADGRLHILRCTNCGFYLHPPRPVCRRCRSTAVAPEPVSGRGSVYSYTINHYQWVPGFTPPYVVATVELDEQSGLQLITNLIDCPDDDLRCDLEVEVLFAHHRDVYIPIFRPAGGSLKRDVS